MQRSHTSHHSTPYYCALGALVLIFSLIITGCEPSRGADNDDAGYVATLADWKRERIEKLKGPAGWLNVAGLFWLKEGVNTFGSAADNDVVFPEGKVSLHAGFFRVANDSVYVEVSPGTDIASKGQVLSKAVIYTPDSVVTLEHGSLQWFVIKRGERLGIRLRDLTSENITAFKGIDAYPIGLQWRVKATFVPHDSATTLTITDITGQVSEQPSPGAVEFAIHDKTYLLDALESGDNLFLIFADSTSGHETYGSGRFLYAAKPGADGTTILDFNKAINPPCAFTAYATCPLPPRQNNLAVSVTAGEKVYHSH